MRLALLALLLAGCATQDYSPIDRMAYRKALQDCVDTYRQARWPNQVIFPNPYRHPCVRCMRGDYGGCREL